MRNRIIALEEKLDDALEFAMTSRSARNALKIADKGTPEKFLDGSSLASRALNDAAKYGENVSNKFQKLKSAFKVFTQGKKLKKALPHRVQRRRVLDFLSGRQVIPRMDKAAKNMGHPVKYGDEKGAKAMKRATTKPVSHKEASDFFGKDTLQIGSEMDRMKREGYSPVMYLSPHERLTHGQQVAIAKDSNDSLKVVRKSLEEPGPFRIDKLSPYLKKR